MADVIYLTLEWLEKLRQELKYLKETKRVEIAEKLKEAISFWDLSENAEYHEAREQQANLEDRIKRLEQLLKTATIVEGATTDTANVGNVVDVQKAGTKTVMTFTLVGSEEADMKEGKISLDSPFGTGIAG